MLAAGASVDAVVIMSSGVLTAAQTGNTILFAAAIARGDLTTGLSAAVSLSAFAGGALAGALLLARHSLWVRPALFFEALTIGALCAWALAGNGGWNNWHVATAAAAMGFQSAITRKLALPFSTTYITGVITNAVAASAERGPSDSSSAHTIGFGAWGIYLAAAIASGFAYTKFSAGALLIPAILSAAAALTLPKPSPAP